MVVIAGADPGLVIGGGANPLGGGADPVYLIYFVKNPMKLKKFWAVGGGAHRERPPLKSATALTTLVTAQPIPDDKKIVVNCQRVLL